MTNVVPFVALGGPVVRRLASVVDTPSRPSWTDKLVGVFSPRAARVRRWKADHRDASRLLEMSFEMQFDGKARYDDRLYGEGIKLAKVAKTRILQLSCEKPS